MGGGGGASGGSGRDMNFFLDMGEAEKHIKHCQSEIDFNNAKGATEFIVKAVALFQKHGGPAAKAVQLTPYQPKGMNTAGSPQRIQDNA